MPYLASDICAPSTTKEQDALKGRWVQVEPNLNIQGYAYLVGFFNSALAVPDKIVECLL